MDTEDQMHLLPVDQWMVGVAPSRTDIVGGSDSPPAFEEEFDDRQFAALLRDFARESIAYLRQWFEWPLRPGEDLDLRGSTMWLSRADDVPSLDALHSFLRKEPLATTLRNTGHQWIWHYEYLPELFLGNRSPPLL